MNVAEKQNNNNNPKLMGKVQGRSWMGQEVPFLYRNILVA